VYKEPDPGISARNVLKNLDWKNYTLLLKNRPVLEPGSPGLFDLQLSGHTHKGRIFPMQISNQPAKQLIELTPKK